MRTSEGDLTPLLTALAKARSAIDVVPKHRTANVGKYTYRYADISDVLAAAMPHLLGNGVVLTQDAATTDAGVSITTRLAHAESGGWIESEPLCLPAGRDAQAVGSAITYGRRYSLACLLGIATEDDDDGSRAKPDNSRDKREAAAQRLGVKPAGEPRASAEAVGELERLIETAEVRQQKILDHYRVEQLGELTASQCEAAASRLRERINKE